MIFEIFWGAKNGDKFAFLTLNKAKLGKTLTKILVFEKNANFFAENCRKSPKIVIITSTPRCYDFKNIFGNNKLAKIAFFTLNQSKIRQNSDQDIGF
jgi:hypothetical protein